MKISVADYLWKRAPEDFCQGSLFKMLIEHEKLVIYFKIKQVMIII